MTVRLDERGGDRFCHRELARQAEAIQRGRCFCRQRHMDGAAAGGDQLAIMTLQLAERAGITLLTYPKELNSQRHGETMSLSEMLRLVRTLDHERALLVMRCVRSAAGDIPGVINRLALQAFTGVLEGSAELRKAPGLIDAAAMVDLDELAVMVRQKKAMNPRLDGAHLAMEGIERILSRELKLTQAA